MEVSFEVPAPHRGVGDESALDSGSSSSDAASAASKSMRWPTATAVLLLGSCASAVFAWKARIATTAVMTAAAPSHQLSISQTCELCPFRQALSAPGAGR